MSTAEEISTLLVANFGTDPSPSARKCRSVSSGSTHWRWRNCG